MSGGPEQGGDRGVHRKIASGHLGGRQRMVELTRSFRPHFGPMLLNHRGIVAVKPRQCAIVHTSLMTTLLFSISPLTTPRFRSLNTWHGCYHA
jgi:hypothetical protein